MANENPYADILGSEIAPTAPANPYDDLLGRVEQSRKVQFNATTTQAVGVNPDAYAKNRKVASYLGYPTSAVETLEKSMHQQAQVQQVQQDSAASPVLQRKYSEIDFAKLAHDDSGILSNLAGAAKYIFSADPERGLTNDLHAGVAGGAGGIAGAFHAVTDVAAAPFDFLEGATAIGGNPLRRLAEGFGIIAQDQLKFMNWRRSKFEDENNFTSGVSSGVQSFAQNVVLAPMALLPGGQAAVLTAMASTAGGQSYEKGLEKGLGQWQALAYGIGDGVIEYATEKLPLHALLEGVKAGSPAWKTFLKTTAAEVPGEQVATVLQDLNEWATLNKDKPFSAYLAERPSAAAQTLVATIIGTGGNVTVMHAAQKVADNAMGIERADQAATSMQQLSELAAQSKLRERSPEVFRETLNEMAANAEGAPAEVRFDARALNDALMQSGLDAAQIEKTFPSLNAQLSEAVATGGEVALPIGEYVTGVSGTPLEQTLLEHARLGDNELSQAEAKEASGQAEQFLQQAAQTVIEQAQDVAGTRMAGEAVKSTVLEQLNATQRFTPDVNEAYASLVGNYYTVMAQRLGTSADALYQQYPMRVQAAGMREDLGATLASKIKGAPAAAIAEYAALPGTDGGRILNTDEARELSEGYRKNRTKSADVHEPASQFVKDLYAAKLAAPTPAGRQPLVLFTAGGTGAGKSTSLQTERGRAMYDAAELVYDTNMNGLESSVKKIEQALAAGRSVAVLYTFRDPVEALTGGALPRAMRMGRTVPLAEHAKTHAGAYKTVAALREKYAADERVQIRVVDNSHGPGAAREAEFDALPQIADTGLEETLYASLEQEHQAGRISPEIFAGTAGVRSEGVGGQRGQAGSSQPQRADEGELEQSARGTYSPSTLTVSLLEKADLSTFLHETGHAFLDMTARMAAEPNAPPAVTEDMGKLLEWFGVSDLATWNSMSLDKQRKSHEKFAESFEQYLFEGKAPNAELQPLFGRFRSWLTNVYRSLTQFMASHNTTLTDEVRGVFDRMLASEQSIRDAEQQRQFAPLFKSAEQAGMTPQAWAAYQAQGTKATEEALSNMEKRSLRNMQWLTGARSRALKELQAAQAERRKAVEAEVAAEVALRPEYQALRWLRKGEMTTAEGEEIKAEKGFRLSTEALAEMYPESALGNPDLDRLKGLTAKNGLHPDLTASMLGFSSGDELVRKMVDLEPQASVVEGLTDQRMLERYGDMATGAGVQRAADEAVHNDARGRFIATGLKALADGMGERSATASGGSVNVMVKAAKEFASNLIARRKVRDLKPGAHTQAEARAGREALKAMGKNDVKAALTAQRDQLLNHYAARETYAAIDEVERAGAYLKKFDKESVRKKLPAEYLDQIDKLLERVDLRTGTTLRELDKRAKLADWIRSQEELGIEPDIPDALLEDVQLTSYKDMSVESFRGLVDTVRQIEHLGRLKSKLLTAKDKREFDAIKDDITSSILKYAGDRKADTRTPATTWGRALQGIKNFGAAHIKAASWARIFDGGKDGGPVWEYFIRPANERADLETTMRAKATKDLTEIMAPVYQKPMGGSGTFFPTVNRSLNREQVFAIALNTGNDSNMQRLLGGEGWTESQLEPILSSLSATEWQAVQGVWDYFESMRPEIGALERRVFGKEPAWIDATPRQVKLRNGETIEVKGGYYPVKYDPTASQGAEQHADAEAAKRQLQNAYSAATVRKGFTKGRVDEVTGRPLLYTMRGVYDGVNDVIHYLAWQEWLIDMNRLLRSQSIDTAVREKYGPQAIRQLRTWRDTVAEGESGTQEALDVALGKLRQGVSVAGLGFNVMSALMQPLGLTQSVVRIGPRWVGKGMTQYVAGPVAATKEVNEKSEFMANRSRTRFRELNELRNRVQGQSKVKELTGRYAYFLMMRVQQAVDVPTWLGAYEKAASEGNDDARAIDLADQAVIDSQGGGQTKDLSAIERGGPALKLFTVFYSFMNTALNLGVVSKMSPTGKAKFAADMLLLYSIPAVLGGILKDALTPGDAGDDDPEKLAKKLAADQLSFLLGLVVVGREFGELGKIAMGDGKARDYSGPAGLRAVADALTFAKQAKQGEFDDAFRKAAINLTGDLFGLPAAQMNRTITGAKALAEGETQNPAALALGFQKPH